MRGLIGTFRFSSRLGAETRPTLGFVPRKALTQMCGHTQRWCCRDIDITQFRPTSSSPTPEQAAFARDYVTRAHAAGRLLRFWNTNDTPEVGQAHGQNHAASESVRANL